MIFTEVRFLFFFLIVWVVFWTLRDQHSRKAWLLLTSYAFYAAWDWRFLSLILISTIVDYVAGLNLARETTTGRKRWLVLSVCVNLSILGFFKYFNFFLDSTAEFLKWLGFDASLPVLSIVLPVGISFYTFQTMSYTIDVYHRKMCATRNLLDLALFVGFFPQLVAGPIVRARDFLPQIAQIGEAKIRRPRALLILFLAGFFKKACVSDNISPFVDAYFADPASYTVASCWIAVILYGVQIYCDFSGYSDMAIATAGMLGFSIPLNFYFPYFAKDIIVFWRRWHISLSSWLRDYLYIPLGGSHGSKLFTYRNLMLTMLLGGLWHGAAWRFVIWGGLHGIALIAVREWRRLRKTNEPTSGAAPSAIGTILATSLTFYWVSVAWIFFRAPDLSSAFEVLRSFVLFSGGGTEQLPTSLWILILVLLFAHFLSYREVFRPWQKESPAWCFSLAYGGMISFSLALQNFRAAPFIYFQF